MTHYQKPSRKGATITGYGLVVGLIAVVAIAATTGIGASVTNLFTDVGGKMDDVVQDNVTLPSPSAGASPSADCSSTRASCKAHLDSGCSIDGIYKIDPDAGGSSFAENDLYCDMTSDDGGWTLVYKDQDPANMSNNNLSQQGTPSACLSHLTDNCASKLSDNAINAINASGSGSEIGYRVTSPDIGNKYYFPNACTYHHDSCGNNFGQSGASHANCQPANATFCMRYIASYTASSSPSYQQCSQWGGHGAGLNAWHACNGTGSYTNVAITHRGYASKAGITTNSSGGALGSAATLYGNSVYMWVR